MSIGISISNALRPAGRSGGGLPSPANNLVVGVGDSITVASANTAGAGITYDTVFQPRLKNTSGLVGGYLTWASILPKTGDTVGNGKLRFNGVHATSGASIATIKANHIDGADSPINDNPKPGIVVVLAGSNDAATISPGGVVDTGVLAGRVANLQAMYLALIAAGIYPVACKVPPTNTVNNQPGVAALNTEIATLAASLGIICLDLFTPCASGSNWIAGYAVADGIHPTVTGAKAMGQALRDGIDSILPAATPNLVASGADTGNGLIFLNGAFLRDTTGSPDGVPDGGYTAESATYWTITANGTATALGARTGFSGNAWRMNKTTDPGTTTYVGAGAGATITPTLEDGHLYELGFVLEVASWSDVTTEFLLNLVKITDGTKVPFRLNLVKDTGFNGAVAPFKFLHTFRCNATTAPAGTYRWNINLGGADAANLADVYLGQLTLRDLGVG